jgi:hypothetical protein
MAAQEISWATAMRAIGLHEEAGQPGLVWQGWCCYHKVPRKEKTMQNFSLRANHTCMAVFDTAAGPPPFLEVEGNDALAQELRAAVDRGTLFARKFDSTDTYWRQWIQSNLHRVENSV